MSSMVVFGVGGPVVVGGLRLLPETAGVPVLGVVAKDCVAEVVASPGLDTGSTEIPNKASKS